MQTGARGPVPREPKVTVARGPVPRDAAWRGKPARMRVWHARAQALREPENPLSFPHFPENYKKMSFLGTFS